MFTISVCHSEHSFTTFHVEHSYYIDLCDIIILKSAWSSVLCSAKCQFTYTWLINDIILSSFTRKLFAPLMVLSCFCSQWWAPTQNLFHYALVAIIVLHSKASTNFLVHSSLMTPARLGKGLACRASFARTRHANNQWSPREFAPVLSVAVPWFSIQLVHRNGGFSATRVTASCYSHTPLTESPLQIRSAQYVSQLSLKSTSTRKPPLLKMEPLCMRVVSCVMSCYIPSLRWSMGSHSSYAEVEGEAGVGDEGEVDGAEEGGGTQDTTILRWASEISN